MLCIIKTIVAQVILMLVGTNLIGLLVRDLFWSPPTIDGTTDRVHEVLSRETRRLNMAKWVWVLFDILLTTAYLFAIFHFWNIGLAAAGGIIMTARIPDLLFEIRTGNKPTRNNLPKGPVYFVASTMLWGSSLLVWYSLCKWTP
jgi:hypothetical protein